MSETPESRLARLLELPDEELNLAEAALLIATHEYPELQVGAYLERLDDMGQAVRARLLPRAEPAALVAELNQFLFEEEGFAGNLKDYYDPRNSYLNEVLDRRLGIPITLSMVYLEVGRRIGLPLEGVSFPGHFLVKFPVSGGEVVLDPFSGGVSLTEEELESRIEHVYGQQAAARMPVQRFLVAARKRDILARMLRNLKSIHMHQGKWEKALGVLDRLLLIEPEDATEWRDRGQVYERLECFRFALIDYQRYLDVHPDADDAEDIRRRIIGLQRSAGQLH
jgi:regulator of sirC expression with transglutaminase-like and TPR domain